MRVSRKLYFFKDYLIDKFGTPLYRIPVDLPLSCPNRQRNSGQGCIFCAEDGARARHLRHHLNLAEQVRSGIDYVRRRYQGGPPYIAYFQSFTNTNAPVEQLRRYYEEVLALADFRMVIIATRPDCLPPDVLDYLEELKQRYVVWVELGVQTSNDRTLELIKRGHDFAAVRRAVNALVERGIPCAAHVILGLPGEGMEDFLQTARDLAALPFSGIKIHNLLVLKNTPLAKLYADKKDEPGWFNINNEYEYADALARFLALIPEEWPLMRLNADAPDEQIIAPKWWMSKGQFLDYLREFIAGGDDADGRFAGAVPKVRTADGSFTFYHPEYKQHFHTLAGAASEAELKFVGPSGLRERLAQGPIRLLDVGYGLGYNAIAAVRCAKDVGGVLDIVTLECDLKTLRAGLAIFPPESLEYRVTGDLLKNGIWRQEGITVSLLTGNAAVTVRSVDDPFDVIFLDGFSPDKNPELWTYDFIRELAGKLAHDGIMTTYSSAFPVLGALMRTGLHVGMSAAFGRKRGGTVAAWLPGLIAVPLADKERNIVLHSTAGVAYRNYSGVLPAAEIIRQREMLVEKLRRQGVPRWYKGR